MKTTEEGMQYCSRCKKDTHHIPKLTLSLEGKRLCSVCRVSNDVKEEIHPDSAYGQWMKRMNGE